MPSGIWLGRRASPVAGSEEGKETVGGVPLLDEAVVRLENLPISSRRRGPGDDVEFQRLLANQPVAVRATTACRQDDPHRSQHLVTPEAMTKKVCTFVMCLHGRASSMRPTQPADAVLTRSRFIRPSLTRSRYEYT